jgi:hypothetical protein
MPPRRGIVERFRRTAVFIGVATTKEVILSNECYCANLQKVDIESCFIDNACLGFRCSSRNPFNQG